MAASSARIVHSLPGRVRIHVPEISVAGAEAVQARAQRMRGVSRARANEATQNVLVDFDAGRLDAEKILRRLDVSVRGLDRDRAEVELPEARGQQDVPAHPLNPAPIMEGATKVIGAGLGVLLVLALRVAGAEVAPVTGNPLGLAFGQRTPMPARVLGPIAIADAVLRLSG